MCVVISVKILIMRIIIILEHLESLENFLWVAIGSYEVCVQDSGTYIS